MSERRSAPEFRRGRSALRVPSWIAKATPESKTIDQTQVSTLRPPRMPADLTQVTIEERVADPPLRNRHAPPVDPVRSRAKPVREEATMEAASPPRADFDPSAAAAAAAMRPDLLQSMKSAETPESRRSPSVFPERGFTVDDATRARLEASLSSIAQVRAQLGRQLHHQLVELCALIAERVISRELSVSRDTLGRLVSEGLDALAQRDQLTVRLGRGFERDAASLESTLAREAPGAKVIVDTSLDDYGCILHTDLGQVDESIDHRLSTVLSIARDAFDEGSDD